jgi:hypothetical protein
MGWERIWRASEGPAMAEPRIAIVFLWVGIEGVVALRRWWVACIPGRCEGLIV